MLHGGLSQVMWKIQLKNRHHRIWALALNLAWSAGGNVADFASDPGNLAVPEKLRPFQKPEVDEGEMKMSHCCGLNRLKDGNCCQRID